MASGTSELPLTGKWKLDMKKAHTVYKNAAGVRLPGVTTVLNELNKPALIGWANRMGLEGIDSTKFVDAAARVGTVAHARIEAYLHGLELDESNITPEELDLSANGFIRFMEWWDRSHLVCLGSELRLVSEKWQVGGTLDVLAKDTLTGERVLVDVKTGSGIYREARMQTAAYAAMYEETHEEKIERVVIARVGKTLDDVFELQEVFNRPAYEAAFEKLVVVHYALKGLK